MGTYWSGKDKRSTHTNKEEDTMSTITPITHTHVHTGECTPPEGYVCVPYAQKGYTYMHTYTYRTVVTEDDPSTLTRALREQYHLHGGWDMDDTYPINPTRTPKEAQPMHYRLTLTTRTTMVWLVISTLSTLIMWALHYHTNLPSWGGIDTLSYLGMVHSAICTLVWGAANVYVRRHGTVVLSTRNLGR